MAKIFVYGERLGGSYLGHLSVDGGAEQKIKANGLQMTRFEYPVSTGKHKVCLYTSGKTQRFLNGAGNDGSFFGTLGGAMSASNSDSFEYVIDFGENDVLILHVVEKVTKTYIEYKLVSESEYKSTYSSISSEPSGGCYVATAVYGSYDCPQVWTLRRYRDYTLASTWYGRAFIRTYYAVSPTLVKWFGKTAWFKKLWKPKLDRMVKNLNAEGMEDTPYQDRVW